MSRVAVSDITVSLGGKLVLDRVSGAFEAGAFVAVVGANGAGKTTLLNVIAGLLKPQGGEVRIDGELLPSIDRKALARRRAYLPQNPRCEWPIPVERLVALGLTPHLPAFGGLGDLEPRLTDIIAALDLTDHRLQPATTLSGGELARAMLARALIGEPDILIADEPTAGLDPRHALDAVRRLIALASDQRRLVIASIHDLTLAARHATHILALDGARVAAYGPTTEVLTSDLLRQVFGVEACVSGSGPRAIVDYVEPR